MHTRDSCFEERGVVCGRAAAARARRSTGFLPGARAPFQHFWSVIPGVHCFQPQLEKSPWKLQVKMGIAVLPQDVLFFFEMKHLEDSEGK